MIRISIAGPPKSGKTAVAQRIAGILMRLGAKVRICDPDGEATKWRPDHILEGREILIDFHQTRGPASELPIGQDVGLPPEIWAVLRKHGYAPRITVPMPGQLVATSKGDAA